jgi:hypothetical protein
MTTKDLDVGIAYGFFYCDAQKEEIEEELPTIRKLAKTPSELELSLNKCMECDGDIADFAQEEEQRGRNYVLEATCPGKTNENIADELESIFNQTYLTNLYEKGDPLDRRIVYE